MHYDLTCNKQSGISVKQKADKTTPDIITVKKALFTLLPRVGKHFCKTLFGMRRPTSVGDSDSVLLQGSNLF